MTPRIAIGSEREQRAAAASADTGTPRQTEDAAMTRRFSRDELAQWLGAAQPPQMPDPDAPKWFRAQEALASRTADAEPDDSGSVALFDVAWVAPDEMPGLASDVPAPHDRSAPIVISQAIHTAGRTGMPLPIPPATAASRPPPIPQALRRAHDSLSGAQPRLRAITPASFAGKSNSQHLSERGDLRERGSSEIRQRVVGKGWRTRADLSPSTLCLELADEQRANQACLPAGIRAARGGSKGRLVLGCALSFAAWWWALGFPSVPFAQATAPDPPGPVAAANGNGAPREQASNARSLERQDDGPNAVSTPASERSAGRPSDSARPTPPAPASAAPNILSGQRDVAASADREIAHALDELALGHQAAALNRYTRLARSQPNRPVYAAIARILDAKLKARCARMGSLDFAACDGAVP